ncbi:DNA primase large subunit, partial [Lobosporangium transversale]
VTGKILPRMEEDDRLMPVLNNINKQYLGREFTTSAIAGEIQAQDVDNLKVHMPLCMEHLHNELRREKHTRHGGRMQYGLFLKGIGLSLEQALIFWQMAFEKLTPDQFNKQYAYNIRHSYGMEGKRTDYTPFSCRHIIQNNAPGPGDHHGCPFRHFSAPNLRATLAAHHVDDFDTEDIMSLVQGRHFQIACTRYYEVTRARMLDIATENLKGGGINGGQGNTGMVASQELIEHPNQFFEQSYLLMQSKESSASIAKSGNGDFMDGQAQSTLQPTVKGQYTYKKSGVQTSSHSNLDMEL